MAESMSALPPAISVGLPVYNGAAHLTQALESLLSQSFTDFEIIISDNCSTDGTPDISARYAARDSRIRTVRQPENIGAIGNFRYVLDTARAPFFTWAAHDDWRDLNFLETMHAALSANTDLEMAMAKIVRVRADGSVADVTGYTPLAGMPRVMRVIKLISLTRGGTIYGLYRTAAIQRAWSRAQRDFPYVWANDRLTMLPFILNDRVVTVNETSFYSRETGLSAVLYRPQTAAQLWPFLYSFLRFAAREIIASRLTPWEKAVCLAYLPFFSNDKAVKWRRLLTRTLRAPFQRAPVQSGESG